MGIEVANIEFTLKNNEIITDKDIKIFYFNGKETKITPELVQIKNILGDEPKIKMILNNGRIVNKSEITNVEVDWNR